MVRRRALAGLFLLALASCASRQAHDAQTWAVGRDVSELVQCAGKPDITGPLPDGTQVYQWDYAEPSGTASVPLPIAIVSDALDLATVPVALVASMASAGGASVSFQTGAGACHAMATVRDGRVLRLRYSGPNGGLSGGDAVCAPIVRECMAP